jgi:cyclophilin family peptidyl-prolyl cis-trans isomerase
LPDQKKAWAKEQEIRQAEAAADDLPRVKFETTKGEIVIELFENEAPQSVANFISLVEKKNEKGQGYYDGLTFHRVLPGFMAQGGDPTGDGSGGPGYEVYCECYNENARQHFRGSLSMAHGGRDTGGSQFFLTFKPTIHLNGKHTAFGRVIEGLDVLAKLQRRDPTRPNPPTPDKIVKAEVVRKRDHKYEPTKVK